jgi:beta-fructofuranosidase
VRHEDADREVADMPEEMKANSEDSVDSSRIAEEGPTSAACGLTLEVFAERTPARRESDEEASDGDAAPEEGASAPASFEVVTAEGKILARSVMDAERFRQHFVVRLPASVGPSTNIAVALPGVPAAEGELVLVPRGLSIPYAYVYGADVMSTGIRVIAPRPFVPQASTAASGAQALDPRKAVHFQPPAHWMNDPNGLCRFQGRYHMFYQFNPYGWEWDNMHWGHAVSADLVHWTQLPVFLFPQRELECDPNLTGGAFSGSAITVDKDGRPCLGDEADAMRIYFTRRRGIKNEDMGFTESQYVVDCHDGLHPDKGTEKRIVTRPNESFGLDFRDPNVRINQSAYVQNSGSSASAAPDSSSAAAVSDDADDQPVYATMAIATSMPAREVVADDQAASDLEPTPGLATEDAGGWYADAPSSPNDTKSPAPGRCPAIAIFSNSTADLEDSAWRFSHIYLADTGNSAACFECPDHFRLGGQDVAVGALMNHRDGEGVYRPVRWYAGKAINGRLQVTSGGRCDDGPCYYAVQSFTDDSGRRIAFGWEQDYLGVRRERPGAANGEMSLPRELTMHGGTLYSRPVEEVYSRLIGEELGSFRMGGFAGRGGLRVLDPTPVKGNAYYADIRFDARANEDEAAHEDFRRPQNFQLLLGEYDGQSVTLQCARQQVWLALKGVPTFGASFVARVGDLKRVEVFYDHGLVECFVNSGEQAITVMIDDPRRDGSCGKLSVMYPNVVTTGEIRQLRL